MRVLLDIKDSKAPFIMELLQNFSFVKAKPITPYKAKVLEDVKEAVEEMKLIKAGKLKAQNAEDLFDMEGGSVYYSPVLKAELDSRYEEYKNGGKLISEATVNKRISKIIKSKSKK